MVFTGRAIYDSGLGTSVFEGVAEDVSDIVGMISPYETPFLDLLGDAEFPARNVLHEWLEDSLNPNTVVSSSTVPPTGTALGMHEGGHPVGRFLQVGAVMKNNRTGEYVQVSATNNATISITRAFGGTTAATIAAGDSFFVVSDAALEGADVSTDISRPRVRRSNYCQIIKKDVIVSGTVQAVNHLAIADEVDYQQTQRLREALRDLEKAVINGKLSGNTLGSATAYRTMQGVWDFITTNVTSTGANSLTPTALDSIIAGAWGQGASDLDLIVVDPAWKAVIDGWNVSRVLVSNDSPVYRRQITEFTGTYGTFQVMMNRWMPSNSLMVLSTQRIKVLPLAGRSFQWIPVARTGDSVKGMILGEYTVEVKNQDGLAKAYGV
ncbi:MAG: DUF5309 family protein [Nitrososphaerota archaeon]